MTKHIIVDGSNIATEGRVEPSLAQLDEAVSALMAEYKNAKVTVIVDATFGHRIAKKERAEFEKALANNELVTPPAGAVGRGDAFILAIADKVNAAIFSNDSFQEFHGKFKWLFDEGRLIGGKPVPLVGWVLVERLPVRGPTSRRSIKHGGVVTKALPAASAEASKPMPVPKTPPPNARLAKNAAVGAKQSSNAKASEVPARQSNAIVNDLVAFLEFVEKHPVGAKVKAVVETFAANGVSVRMGSIAGYVPLKYMSTPSPRSARDVFKLGDQVSLMVVGYAPSRRSVDLGVPEVVSAKVTESLQDSAKTKTKKTTAKKTAVVKKGATKKVATKTSITKPTPTKPTGAKKVVAKKVVAKKAVAKTVVPKKTVVKKTATTVSKKVAKTVAKKVTATKKIASKKK